jgi:hypothetical protein
MSKHPRSRGTSPHRPSPLAFEPLEGHESPTNLASLASAGTLGVGVAAPQHAPVAGQAYGFARLLG